MLPTNDTLDNSTLVPPPADTLPDTKLAPRLSTPDIEHDAAPSTDESEAEEPWTSALPKLGPSPEHERPDSTDAQLHTDDDVDAEPAETLAPPLDNNDALTLATSSTDDRHSADSHPELSHRPLTTLPT